MVAGIACIPIWVFINYLCSRALLITGESITGKDIS